MKKSAGDIKREKDVAASKPLLKSSGFSSKTDQAAGTTITAEGAAHPTQPKLKPTEELAFVSNGSSKRAMAHASRKIDNKPPRPPISSGKGGSINSSSF